MVGAFICALAFAGCHTHPKESADALLRESLATYAAHPTFATDCKWTATDGTSTFNAARVIEYHAPNRYAVKAIHDNSLLLASVSDGAQVTEYSNVPGMIAGIYPAPSTLASADAPQMTNPIDCGSPLYAFFAGPDGYTKLVDPAAKAPRYGDTVDVDGVSCINVVFTEPGGFGQVTAAIGTDDKLVRRITYDAAALVAKGATQEVDSAPSSGAPPFLKSVPHNPASLMVTEEYDFKAATEQVADNDFDTSLPDSLPPFRVAENPAGGDAASSTDADLGKPPVPLGSPAPDISVIDTRTGKPTTLSSMRGQVVMLDFFASWCMPCRASLPETQKLHALYGGHGLAVMGIDGESRAKIKEFLAESHYNFPAYEDHDASASRAYQANAIPTVAIIDRQGCLSFYGVGLQEKGTIEAELKKAGI